MANIFYPLTRNIGDDLQMVALILLCNQSYNLLPRDNFERNHLLIEEKSLLNGWLSKTTFENFDFVRVAQRTLPISFHIADKRHLENDWLKFFQSCHKILTRDIHTQSLLESKGIEAKFCGCLTLQIGKHFKPVQKKKYIICTEKKYISQLKESFSNIYFFDPNFLPTSACLGIPTRVAYAIKWLQFLAEAELVVSDRIHAAFPSLSFGTRVLFPGIDSNELPTGSVSRITGFEDLLSSELNRSNNFSKEVKELTDKFGNLSAQDLKDWTKEEIVSSQEDLFYSFNLFKKIIKLLNLGLNEKNLKKYYQLGNLAFLDSIQPVTSSYAQVLASTYNQVLPFALVEALGFMDDSAYSYSQGEKSPAFKASTYKLDIIFNKTEFLR